LLSDSPYCKENRDLFVSDNEDLQLLIQDLENGSPTCYLISGYRGAGKSSFVKKMEELIHAKDKTEESDCKEIVFVYSYFSKYHSQSHLLRKLIRGLYLELRGLPSFVAIKKGEHSAKIDKQSALLIENLYEKTFYDTSSSKVTTSKEETVTVFGIDFIAMIHFLLPSLLFILFTLNLIYCFLSSSAIFNIASLLISAFAGVKYFIQYKRSSTSTTSEQEDFNRKSLYDDEIADYHFYSVLKEFGKFYKVVFVLDELDKVSEKHMDKLLNEMKPHLVSGVASFIVVAGQNLFYKYNSSKSKDDALLSSIFSKSIHIPLLSREEFQSIFKNLISSNGPISEDHNKVISGYVDWLVFKSRRVPRIFINLVRDDLRRIDGEAHLELKEEPGYRIYSEILDSIDNIDDRDISSEGFDPAIKDFFIMQLFLRTQRMLFSRITDFSIEEISKNNE